MWEFIHKIVLLFVERKNKFQNVEDKLERRIKYFEDIKAINALDVEDAEKRARKNAVAQALVGSQGVSFYLIDFLIKNKNITNYETIAKTIALWDTSLIIDRNDDNQIIGVGLNKTAFIFERSMLTGTLLFTFVMLICSLNIFKYIVSWLNNNLMIPEYISVILMLVLVLGLITACIFLFITTLILFDLKRIVDLINKEAL